MRFAILAALLAAAPAGKAGDADDLFRFHIVRTASGLVWWQPMYVDAGYNPGPDWQYWTFAISWPPPATAEQWEAVLADLLITTDGWVGMEIADSLLGSAYDYFETVETWNGAPGDVEYKFGLAHTAHLAAWQTQQEQAAQIQGTAGPLYDLWCFYERELIPFGLDCQAQADTVGDAWQNAYGYERRSEALLSDCQGCLEMADTEAYEATNQVDPEQAAWYRARAIALYDLTIELADQLIENTNEQVSDEQVINWEQESIGIAIAGGYFQ